MKLLLILPEAFEVVEMLAVLVHEVAEAVPQRRACPLLEARERRHAEVEPAVAFLPAPQHELREQKVHGAVGRLGGVAHEVDRQLFLAGAQPQVGEGDRALAASHHCDRKLPQVGEIERGVGEALLARGLGREPVVRDALELSERHWSCSSCGAAHDRDINAAINLKHVAERYSETQNACGATVSPKEPRKRHPGRVAKKQELATSESC